MARAIVLLAGLLVSVQAELMASDTHHLNEEQVTAVNTSKCLGSIEAMELKHFRYSYKEFETTHFENRLEIGLIAQEAISVVPDGVAAVSELVVVKDKGEQESKEPTRLKNILVLDPETVFWNNVGASQELLKKHHRLDSDVVDLSQGLTNTDEQITRIDAILEKEATVDLVERRKIAEEQKERAELELEAVKKRGEDELESIKKRGEDELEATTKRGEDEKERAELELEAVKKRGEDELEAVKQRGKDELLALEARSDAETKHADYVDALAEERSEKAAKRTEARFEKEHERAKDRNVELVRMQLDAAEKQETARMANERQLEEMRAQTSLKVAKMEHDASIEQAKVEAEAKIRQERENEDIAQRKLMEELEAQRERTLQGIKMAFALIANGVTNYLKSPQQILSTVMVVGLMGLMLQLAKAAGTEVSRRLAIPSLVRETSRNKGTCETVRRMCERMMWWKSKDPFHGIVLKKTLEKRVRRLALSVRNMRRHGAPMRHCLFYGPPGTGKTMTARRFAHRAGLDYAIMTGGDVAPLGKEGVTELHKLFGWAANSSRGLLLFIDEAEAFLGSRSGQISESLRNAVSAILYHTGTPQKTFMLVLATNRPGDLDVAVLDRIDEALEFQVPDLEGRQKLLKHYFNQNIRRFVAPKRCPRLRAYFGVTPIKIGAGVTDEAVEALAAITDKFSGREINKMMMSIQAAVYGSEDCELSLKYLKELVKEMIQDQRKKWALLSKRTAWS